MIRHVVLFKFKSETTVQEIEEIFEELAGLQHKVPGIAAYHAGPYLSHEGLNQDFTHGFTMDFQDSAARDAYLPHPAHEAVKTKIVNCLDGGIKGVIAFDFAV